MKKLFKVKIKIPGNPISAWVPVKAKSKGDVIVLMDHRTMNSTRTTIRFEEIEEIKLEEYNRMLYKNWSQVKMY